MAFLIYACVERQSLQIFFAASKILLPSQNYNAEYLRLDVLFSHLQSFRLCHADSLRPIFLLFYQTALASYQDTSRSDKSTFRNNL